MESLTARLLRPAQTIRQKLQKRKIKNQEKMEENKENKRTKKASCFLWCLGINISDDDDYDSYVDAAESEY
jgi:hypothetical protein